MSQHTHQHRAIAAIFRRMDAIAEQCGDQFPLFRAATDSQWTLSRRGSWMGGFWAGLWWLKASMTGAAADRAQAAQWCAKLAALLDEPSINRSFVFWYGAGLGDSLHGDATARALAQRAARAMRESFDAALAVWPLGIGMGAGERGGVTLDVDALAPLVCLIHAHGGQLGRTLAQWHLDSCLKHLADKNGAWRSRRALDMAYAAERQAPEIWPRGQAWAMLGLAEAARCYGIKRYADAALRACAYWQQHYASGNNDQADPSALAIAAVAMLRLWQQVPGQDWLHEQSCLHLKTLLTPDVVQTGIFVGHHYQTRPGTAEWVESPCALFFLLQALLLHTHTQPIPNPTSQGTFA